MGIDIEAHFGASLSERKGDRMQNEEIEAILLSAGSAAEMIERKLTEELEAEKARTAEKKKQKYVTDFSKVPESKVFTESCYYRLFNKETKREFIINGRQLESRLGMDSALYEKVLARTMSAFCAGNSYVKFDKCM